MMNVLERPHYVVKPTELADWLDREPETWWMVDFDPRLTGRVDFPCPSDELSDALALLPQGHLRLSDWPGLAGAESQWPGHRVGATRRSAGSRGPRAPEDFLLSWSDRDDWWSLSEYPASKLPELQDQE